ncbi:ribosome-inactivating family protein [Aquimarina sp. RZ0]|uniref:ribosome-inactivating family protein n=1 Tax=Aquimarina sp. RZ0 TaxID=2607730 RepID=UPI0011F11457|nr:ribosome-inactivating family protein [Aquimarina sp. RZ0]KAA1246182.1 hypothetical protein F0000_08575 [Aquimarina sp. RZ0]
MKFLKTIYLLLFIVWLSSCEKEERTNINTDKETTGAMDLEEVQLKAPPRIIARFFLNVSANSNVVARNYRKLIFQIRNLMDNNRVIINRVREMRAPSNDVYRIRVGNGNNVYTDYYFSTANMYLIGVGYIGRTNQYSYSRLRTSGDQTVFEGSYSPGEAGNRIFNLPFSGEYGALQAAARNTRARSNINIRNMRSLAGSDDGIRAGSFFANSQSPSERAYIIMNAAIAFSEGARFHAISDYVIRNVRRSEGGEQLGGNLETLTNNWGRISRNLRDRLRNPNTATIRVGQFTFNSLQIFGRVLGIALRPTCCRPRHH